jgi:alpha-tubulin suppressor-like RCC1 family protein
MVGATRRDGWQGSGLVNGRRAGNCSGVSSRLAGSVHGRGVGCRMVPRKVLSLAVGLVSLLTFGLVAGMTVGAGASVTAQVVRPSVSEGTDHGCSLSDAGSVACWGKNSSGELGDGSTSDTSSPVSVVGLENAVAVTAGYDHSCALIAHGSVECWGRNANDQLGIGTATGPQTCNGFACSTTPVTVTGLAGVASVSAGDAHTCAVLANRSVKCWGWGLNGDLGDGNGTNSATPVVVSGLTNATAVSASGAAHSCALLMDHTVACWGSNFYGQLGLGSTTGPQTCEGFACSPVPVAVPGLTNVIAISLGDEHTCAVITDGTMKCWGGNYDGQLGDGTMTNRSSPVTVVGITNAISVAAGVDHSCALLRNDTVDCWGLDNQGQLGDNTTTMSPTAVTVSSLTNASVIASGGSSSCAITTNPMIVCWGANGNGQLGNGTTTNASTPAVVTGSSTLFDCHLTSVANGRYVSTELGYTGALYGVLHARATVLGPWERYKCIPLGTNQWSIKSRANGRYVSTELSYTATLYGTLRARATTIGPWEQYRFVSTRACGCDAIRAVNAKYVSTELAYSGTKQALLRARASTIGTWEQYNIKPG